MRFTLAAGPYQAGFRAVEQYDRVRTFEGNLTIGVQSRPIQTSIWYPARAAKDAAPMRYQEYVDLVERETGFGPSTPASRAAARKSFTEGFLGLTDSLHVRREFNALTRAYRNAPHVPGKFPVIIYGPSFNAPSFENSDLFEYLASHGYVVVASPCIGWFQRGMTADALGVETQARDMEFLLAYAATLPGVDMSRVAVMGFSWGGISDVVVGLRNPRVRAVVALDGTVAYRYPILRSVPSVDVKRMDAPFLFLQSQAMPPDTAVKYKIDTAFTFFDSLAYAPAYRVRFHQMTHQNFGAWFIRLNARTPAEADQATVNYGYEQVTRYVQHFLDAYLRGDRDALAFLARTPEENGVRVGFAAMQRKQPRGPAPTLVAFSRQLGSSAPAGAPALLEKLQRADSSYRLPEEAVNWWGYALLRQDRPRDAVGVFQLNTRQNPGSSNVWDSLGEALMAAGALDSAIVSYERSLAIDSTNTNAKRRLGLLRARREKP